jgi:hypothetical protein
VSWQSCGVAPEPPIGSDRAIVPTQRIHASVIQAPDSAELAAAIGIAVATSAEPTFLSRTHLSCHQEILLPCFLPLSPQIKCLTKKGSSATVSIVAAFVIGQSVAPALPEGNALIRLYKEKVWQGRALPSRYCCEKVPWREHQRPTRPTRWPPPSNLTGLTS